jgi:hypothetical protein
MVRPRTPRRLPPAEEHILRIHSATRKAQFKHCNATSRDRLIEHAIESVCRHDPIHSRRSR